MKTIADNTLATLTPEEILCVGGSGQLRKELRAMDKNGNTLSIEEWMDLQLATALGGRTEHTSIFDFYDPGYNANKPNNRQP